jgi:hypothetical protein
VEEISSSEYAIDDRLSRLTRIPLVASGSPHELLSTNF